MPPTLRELGITKQQSSQWQQVAAIPKKEFNEIISDPAEVSTTQGVMVAGTDA